jgi:hypothetical protein
VFEVLPEVMPTSHAPPPVSAQPISTTVQREISAARNGDKDHDAALEDVRTLLEQAAGSD